MHKSVNRLFHSSIDFSQVNHFHTEGEHRYVIIDDLQEMDPFFLNIISAGNHWFFCDSNGTMSAGRHSPDTALFPYYTVDKIMDNWNTTGAWTAIQVDGKLWEPFKPTGNVSYKRRLMKSEAGDEVVFQETGEGLRFTHHWQLSERYGFMRTVKLENISGEAKEIRIVDGLDNLLPAGVDQRTQNEYSCLTDAYKASELLSDGKLMVHRLASGITDEAIPMESLYATTVWTHGLEGAFSVLGREDAKSFLRGEALSGISAVRASRGAFFRATELQLQPGEASEWVMVAEINQSQVDVTHLLEELKDPKKLLAEVRKDVLKGREYFQSLIASADGVQLSADRDVSLHHYQNTLSNILRGGVPAEEYFFKRDQILSYVGKNNQLVLARHKDWLSSLSESYLREDFLALVAERNDADLLRLVEEYLPLMLSRRHGDPSRPWNKFHIRVKDESGSPVLGFQGNWRDIFQNWEALSLAYPGFLNAFISKFLNASTVDGFNPYRITSEGCDWEAPDPDDPWASIGYWGDHQIIYLLKLLELQLEISPDALIGRLNDARYVYANVPYVLSGWERTLEDPRETITFDEKRHEHLMREKARYGGDALILRNDAGETVRVTLAEKLLLPAVVKLANLVPNGGVWMNTQRPEWNDANNALAGYGLSVVTAGYLNRYLVFLNSLLSAIKEDSLLLTAPLLTLINEVHDIMKDARWENSVSVSEGDCFSLVALSGKALESYRDTVYAGGLGTPVSVKVSAIRSFITLAQGTVERTLKANLRADGLYHAYNTLEIDREGEKMGVSSLAMMLEGQVSILSSGLLTASEAASLLEKMSTSDLISERHRTYLLYPDKPVKGFLEGNKLSESQVRQVASLARMVESADGRLVEADSTGGFRFHPSLTNEYELAKVLDQLKEDSQLGELIEADHGEIEALYEETFNHQSFTGRSGSMFGYEGLGCIYWHMVSKLMLAVQEVTLKAFKDDESEEVIQGLISAYFSVQSGLGFRKTAKDYGAFPAEAYSHSPAHAGCQQPGLTGQVKEGILCRFGELGVHFSEGKVSFTPRLLRDAEFSDEALTEIGLDANTMSFTLAQTPVSYKRMEGISEPSATVYYLDGSEVFPGGELTKKVTQEITSQSGRIRSVEVLVPSSWLIQS